MPDRAGIRFLVIEDSPVAALHLRASLEKIQGWTTVWAASLTAARAHVQEHGAFDVLMVDLTLPDAQGLEAVEFARASSPSSVCVVHTAEEELSIASQALRIGAADILVKGKYSPEHVQRIVQLALVRRDLEQQKEESERNLRTVLESMTEALVVVGAEGQVLFSNRPAQELSVRFADGDGPGTRLQAAPGVVEQTSVATHDGRTLMMDVRTQAIGWADKPARLVTLRDLTTEREIHEYREQLREKEELAQVGDRSYKDWHDVNNKLFVLDSAVRQLARTASGQAAEPDDDTDPLGTLLANIEEIRAMAARYRRNVVERPGVFETIDVAPLVQLKAQSFRHRADKHATVGLRLGAVPAIYGDRVALGNAIENLLTNALKALQRQQRAEAGEIVITTAVEGTHVVIGVSDNGPGFPAGPSQRWFQSRVSADPTGQGLGLSSVQDTMRRLQGEVQISSEPGKGATVSLRLPIPVTASVPIPDGKPEEQGRRRVLLIDDDPFVLRASRRVLAKTYEVEIANHGGEAIEKLEAGFVPDAILCDLEMPTLDGPGVWATVSERWPHLLRHMAFCSGGASSPEMIAFLDRTSPMMLRKPFKENDAIALIERLATGLGDLVNA